jgi:hypothetical protein
MQTIIDCVAIVAAINGSLSYSYQDGDYYDGYGADINNNFAVGITGTPGLALEVSTVDGSGRTLSVVTSCGHNSDIGASCTNTTEHWTVSFSPFYNEDILYGSGNDQYTFTVSGLGNFTLMVGENNDSCVVVVYPPWYQNPIIMFLVVVASLIGCCIVWLTVTGFWQKFKERRQKKKNGYVEIPLV